MNAGIVRSGWPELTDVGDGVVTAAAGAVPRTAETTASAQADTGNGALEQLQRQGASRWRGLVFYGAVIALLWYGWRHRGDVYLAPDEGAGYLLGIAGGSMMLMLLLYPLRKHAGWMRRLGPVSHWFRLHMLLGVIGPVCILFHCNFRLGSLNGNVALFSMLVVATSGLAGRYLYARIHYGLYGSKADLNRLSGDASALRRSMQSLFESVPGMRDMLSGLERTAQRLPDTLAGSVLHIAATALRSRLVAIRLGWHVRRVYRRDDPDQARMRMLARKYLRVYMNTIRRVAGFTFYERLFSLWHVLHLPLFVMLLISGVVHVVAVHIY